MTSLWDISGCIRVLQCLRSTVILPVPLLFKCPIWPRDLVLPSLTISIRIGERRPTSGRTGGNDNYETTYSVGPRFIWRTDEANYFLHSLVSLNRVSIGGLSAGNGIGAILGGGMDLPINKKLAFRLFEADYVWSRHNYSDFADSDFPDLRRASVRRRPPEHGTCFSWGGAPPVTPAASCSVQPTEVFVGEPISATVVHQQLQSQAYRHLCLERQRG